VSAGSCWTRATRGTPSSAPLLHAATRSARGTRRSAAPRRSPVLNWIACAPTRVPGHPAPLLLLG